jgi:hypothetical protein
LRVEEKVRLQIGAQPAQLRLHERRLQLRFPLRALFRLGARRREIRETDDGGGDLEMRGERRLREEEHVPRGHRDSVEDDGVGGVEERASRRGRRSRRRSRRGSAEAVARAAESAPLRKGRRE